MNVATKIGVFEVRKSDNNAKLTDVYHGNQRLATINAEWWNKDAIVNAIEANKSVILANMGNVSKEKDEIIADLRNRIQILESEHNKVNVNPLNVVEVLETANNVLKSSITDNKKRGFVCSRLSQITNKLWEDLL